MTSFSTTAMIICCKCLNISIIAKTPDLQDVDVSNLELSELERNNQFFKENLCTVELVRISKEQGSLVQVQNVGNWIIHKCINCLMNTHAIHRERGAGCVLLSQALLKNTTDIAALKASDKYSTVFRIVVDHVDKDLAAAHTPTKFSVSQLPGTVQTALSAIQQQLNEAIQQEVASTEEKIRTYSEQQYAALEEFRENAHNDHRTLIRLLHESQESLSADMKTTLPLLNDENKPPMSTSVPHLPYSLGAKIPNSSVPGSGDVVSSSRRQEPVADPSPVAKVMRTSTAPFNSGDGSIKTERRVKSQLFSQVSNQGSLDTEGLFDLEGMEDNPAEVFHSEEESDTDDSGSNDEGIHIPRNRGGQYNLAKSLPMNVPKFFSTNMRGEDQVDERLRPQGPKDIAASIKALAKSVHGDANVFGDLPRPRFSTQI